jgi:methionyl-tRNA formyltransferase
MERVKYIYFGSSEFSRIIIEDLIASGKAPLVVVTRPDKPKDRGLKVQPTKVSIFADTKRVKCLKPDSLKDAEFQKIIKEYSADFFVVADYGAIMPESLLALARQFTLCVHPSLLPLYRGASPIESALLNGDDSTGVTIFKVNEKVDSGDILIQKETPIDGDDDHYTLINKLAKVGVPLLLTAIDSLDKGDFTLIPQNNKKATLTHKITKADGKISWSEPAAAIYNKIRAFRGWPKAYTYYKKCLIQILSAEVIEANIKVLAGEIVNVDKQGIDVACGKNILKIKSLKPQGKNEMSSWSFVCGHHLKVSDRFSSNII